MICGFVIPMFVLLAFAHICADWGRARIYQKLHVPVMDDLDGPKLMQGCPSWDPLKSRKSRLWESCEDDGWKKIGECYSCPKLASLGKTWCFLDVSQTLYVYNHL